MILLSVGMSLNLKRGITCLRFQLQGFPFVCHNMFSSFGLFEVCVCTKDFLFP